MNFKRIRTWILLLLILLPLAAASAHAAENTIPKRQELPVEPSLE